MSRRLSSAATAVAGLALLAACSTNPATGKQSFTGFMSPQDEARVGAEEHPKMLRAFGGQFEDAALGAYVRSIGKRLAAVSEAPGLPYRFTVLNSAEVNAFALPGGYVYVTRGLVSLAEDEAELAGVIAHEIGHVTARHTAERYSQTVATNIGLTTLGVVGSILGVPSGVGNVVSLGADAALRGYSRSQELEADMLGVRYMTRIGYDPEALVGFFEKLDMEKRLRARAAGKSEEAAVRNSIMSTHPRTADRIRQAVELAQVSEVAERRRERDALLARVENLVHGDDPREGLVKGNAFIHPDLGFRFEAPPGFEFDNRPDRVVARNADGALIVFDMERDPAELTERDLTVYLTQRWNDGLALSAVERIDVNGLRAATGRARVSAGRAGPRDLRRIAIRGHAERIFRFTFLTPPELTERLDLAFRRATYSFRLLSSEEAAAVEPRRIVVVTARPGDTPESLAATMPFGRFNDDWFRLLNANVVGDGLAPGERVKLVVD